MASVTVQRVGGEFNSPGPPLRSRICVPGQPRLLFHVLSWVNWSAPRLRTHPCAAEFREYCTVLLTQRLLVCPPDLRCVTNEGLPGHETRTGNIAQVCKLHDPEATHLE